VLRYSQSELSELVWASLCYCCLWYNGRNFLSRKLSFVMRYAPHVLTRREKRKKVNKYISHLSPALKAHLKIILKNPFWEKIKDQLQHFHRGWGTSVQNDITSHRQTWQGNEIYWDQQSSNRPTEPQNVLLKRQLKWELVHYQSQLFSSSSLIKTFITRMKH